jgi:hypothetical protein
VADTTTSLGFDFSSIFFTLCGMVHMLGFGLVIHLKEKENPFLIYVLTHGY